MKDFIDECNNTISQVEELLKQNTEWISRYARYAKKINAKLETIKGLKEKRFHEWAPLYLYMTVSQAKGQMQFGLRYLGQDVAKLKVAPGKITISTKGFDAKNAKYFECGVELGGSDWISKETASFRRHFSNYHKNAVKSGKGNEEHRIESMLLTGFSKKRRKDKYLCNIQPVKIAGIARFQMPTPIRAADIKKVEFAGAGGGGIDILSRIGTGKATKLCIMELKDENNSKETPFKAIQQGLAYATFIRELLRSVSGKEWWKIFGFSGKLPDQIELYVACVMPSKNNNDTSFANIIIKTTKVSFHLNYIYFQEEDNKVVDIVTSLKQCSANQAT
jgi:hypothetical protein